MAFHPYPQLIRALFNVNRFGPPGPVTDPSAWPRVDHRVSRLSPATGRPVQTRSRYGSAPEGLSLAAEEQLVGSLCKRHAVALARSDRLQTDGFRFCFTPLPGVLPTFPSRYWYTVGLPVVFSLAGWSPLFRTGFLVSRPTQVAAPRLQVAPTGFHPLRPAFPRRSGSLKAASGRSYYPAHASTRTVWAPPFSLAATRGIDSFFLLLRVLRCFSSPGSPRLMPVTGLQPAGLPHSEMRGSIHACRSPRLFAACRVLHRLRKPRHPPSALFSLLSVNLLRNLSRRLPMKLRPAAALVLLH